MMNNFHFPGILKLLMMMWFEECTVKDADLLCMLCGDVCEGITVFEKVTDSDYSADLLAHGRRLGSLAVVL
jgi:hypothetical protein